MFLKFVHKKITCNQYLKGRFRGSAHVQAIVFSHSISLFIKKFNTADDSCGKFAFENFAVSHKNMTIKVRFLIKIPFVCSDSVHKILFRFPVDQMYFRNRRL